MTMSGIVMFIEGPLARLAGGDVQAGGPLCLKRNGLRPAALSAVAGALRHAALFCSR